MTFNISEGYFGHESIEELVGLLSTFEGYTDDEENIRHVWKRLKLGHVFRKNRYEYRIARQRFQKIIRARRFGSEEGSPGGGSK